MWVGFLDGKPVSKWHFSVTEQSGHMLGVGLRGMS